MDKIKDKGAIIVCAVAIILIVVLLVVQGGDKQNENNTVDKNAVNNVSDQANNTVTEEFVNVQSDGSKVNTSEELKKTKTVDGLEISNIRLVENGGLSQLVADAKNTTDTMSDELNMIITVLDKDGNVLATLDASVYSLGAGKTTTLQAGITDDIANAYDFTVTKK